MKFYSLCTRWYMFLLEVPLVILFWMTLRFNEYSNTALKFYPLLTVLALAIFFVFDFFFRVLCFSYDEVRMFGRFSSRDKCVLNEGKTLILTRLPKRKIKVEVFGNDGVVAGLNWLAGTEPHDIYLFRAKTIGSDGKIAKLLRFYGVDESQIPALQASGAPHQTENETTSVTASDVDGCREIRIRFLVTMK